MVSVVLCYILKWLKCKQIQTTIIVNEHLKTNEKTTLRRNSFSHTFDRTYMYMAIELFYQCSVKGRGASKVLFIHICINIYLFVIFNFSQMSLRMLNTHFNLISIEYVFLTLATVFPVGKKGL